MKKCTAIVLSLVFVLTLFTGTALAKGDLKLQVNGADVTFQAGKPIIEKGTSLVPLRDLLVSLGVQNDTKHIIWNGKEASVTAVKGDKSLKLTVGDKRVFLNDALYSKLEVPAKNIKGQVYLPARAVAEAFGFYITFDSLSQTIMIQEVPFGGGVKADDYEDIPDESDKIVVNQNLLDQIQVSLKGGKLEIIGLSGFDVKITSIQIMEYSLPMKEPMPIPGRHDGGLAIPFSSFINMDGQSFNPIGDEANFISIKTDQGEIMRYESHDASATASLDEHIYNTLRNQIGGAKFYNGQLVLEFETKYPFSIDKMSIDGTYTYVPTNPIEVTSSNAKVTVPLSEFKSASGAVFVPKKDGQWNLTHGVTIHTSYGELQKGVSDETPAIGQDDPNRLNAADPNQFLEPDQEDDGSRLNAITP